MSNSFLHYSIRMLAIVSVAICLIPAGAHFFEMPNKMALPPGEYMTVQRIYTGWAFFGIAVFAALALTLAHTVSVWGQPKTRNWTVTPDNLEAARRQWEYSHAVNAGITLLSLVLIIAAVLAGKAQDAPAR
jgi:hypothetical protein